MNATACGSRFTASAAIANNNNRARELEVLKNIARNVFFTALYCSSAIGLLHPTALLAESGVIEEVVVTAQKRTENLQDVPISVSALNADTIEKLNIQTSADLTAHVPNMQVMPVHGELRPVYSIRGQSMIDVSNNTSSPVGVYVDENYLGLSFMRGIQLFDLERIEVLRGPQGTLYGKNTTGGAINFISKSPGFERAASLKVGYGSHDRREINVAVDVPLIEDTFALRVAHQTIKTDGYIDNHAAGKRDLDKIDLKATRLSLVHQQETLRVALKYSDARNDSTPTGSVIETHLPDPAGSDQLVNFNGYSRPHSFDSWDIEANIDDRLKTESKLGVLKVDWDISDSYTLTSVSAVADASLDNPDDVDGSPYSLYEAFWRGDVEQVSQDLRITSIHGGPFNFVAGIYYAEEDLDVYNELQLYKDPNCCIPIPGGLQAEQSYNQTITSKAVYSHMTYDFTERAAINLGLRYSNDEGELADAWVSATILGTRFQSIPGGDVSNILTLGFPTTPYDPEARHDTIHQSDNQWSGEFGFDYQATDDVLLYSKYSRGYRSGSFNGNAIWSDAQIQNTVKPEKVDAYEVGIKSQWFNNSLQLNSAAFYYDYRNQQFVNIVNFQALLENAGESTITGLELEILAQVNRRLLISAGLGLLQTEYDDLVLTDPQGAGLFSSFDAQPLDLSGNDLVLAPEVNFNFMLDYTVIEHQHGNLKAIFDTVYVDDQWFTAYNNQGGNDNIRADGYWMSNAILRWTSANEDWSVSGWVKNIEDNDESAFAVNLKAEGGFDQFKVPAPRRYGIDLAYHF